MKKCSFAMGLFLLIVSVLLEGCGASKPVNNDIKIKESIVSFKEEDTNDQNKGKKNIITYMNKNGTLGTYEFYSFVNTTMDDIDKDGVEEFIIPQKIIVNNRGEALPWFEIYRFDIKNRKFIYKSNLFPDEYKKFLDIYEKSISGEKLNNESLEIINIIIEMLNDVIERKYELKENHAQEEFDKRFNKRKKNKSSSLDTERARGFQNILETYAVENGVYKENSQLNQEDRSSLPIREAILGHWGSGNKVREYGNNGNSKTIASNPLDIYISLETVIIANRKTSIKSINKYYAEFSNEDAEFMKAVNGDIEGANSGTLHLDSGDIIEFRLSPDKKIMEFDLRKSDFSYSKGMYLIYLNNE